MRSFLRILGVPHSESEIEPPFSSLLSRLNLLHVCGGKTNSTAVLREPWATLPESSSRPLLAQTRNLAHASLETAVHKPSYKIIPALCSQLEPRYLKLHFAQIRTLTASFPEQGYGRRRKLSSLFALRNTRKQVTLRSLYQGGEFVTLC